MDKKSFLEERYCEINKLKNMLQTYPKEYCSTIIKVMESVCEDITSYLNKGKSKKDKKMRSTDNVFTKEQLSEYDGQNRNKIYGVEEDTMELLPEKTLLIISITVTKIKEIFLIN